MGRAGSRRLRFSTIFNVRDLEGFETPHGPVLPHRFLRAGDTMALSDEDRARLLAYGVRRVADLRMAIERPDRSSRLAQVEGVAWRNFQLVDDRTLTPEWTQGGRVVQFVYEGHLRMLRDRQALRDLMGFIAEANRDECVLFHCAGGMDRTGLVSMVVLGLCGCARRDLLADYGYAFASDEVVDELVASMGPDTPPCEHDGVEARLWAMARLVDHIEDEFGSVRGLVASWGVTDETIGRIVEHATRT